MVCVCEAQPGGAGPERPAVLVVEDEILIRMAISEYLRDCGFIVVEAGNAAEALAVLQASASIGVVFTDVQMPGDMNGFGLARWVRENRPGVEVIITSGVSGKAEEAAELCRHSPLVTKPYQHTDVEKRLRLLLKSRDRSAR